MYPFYFRVKVNDEPSPTFESGLGLAESFANASDQIESYFGNDLISIEHLALMEENMLILMPDDACKMYEERELGRR